MLTGSESFSRACPQTLILRLLDMFPWLGWKGMSKEGLSICGDVSPVYQVCVLLKPNMAGEQEEGEKEGIQVKSAFSECLGPFLSLFYVKSFSLQHLLGAASLQPQCRWFQQTCVRCCRDHCELCFQLYCRSTVRRGNYANNMWNPFGVHVAFHRPFGFNSTACKLMLWTITPLN